MGEETNVSCVFICDPVYKNLGFKKILKLWKLKNIRIIRNQQ